MRENNTRFLSVRTTDCDCLILSSTWDGRGDRFGEGSVECTRDGAGCQCRRRCWRGLPVAQSPRCLVDPINCANTGMATTNHRHPWRQTLTVRPGRRRSCQTRGTDRSVCVCARAHVYVQLHFSARARDLLDDRILWSSCVPTVHTVECGFFHTSVSLFNCLPLPAGVYQTGCTFYTRS